ncbi:MAG: sigma-E processing peptidase SpoIIGA [Clostridiales bacterium]|jgi:stage II sporulation protein GA (sporulation sigma-E factor processing peptidase)|nr:sigma-E processing peptidase SpoIIGA [Clostridiales bacterium]
MEVYIEYVIIDNIAIDFLIAMFTLKTLRLRVRYIRVILSALVGTGFAAVMPYIHINSYILLAVKVVIAAILVGILYPYKTVKRFFAAYLVFFGYTFLTGGACIGLIYLMTGDTAAALSLTYQAPVSAGAVLLLGAAAAWVIYKAVCYVDRERVIMPFMRRFTLAVGTREASLNGLIDSGNGLFDPKTALPVIVVKARALAGVFPESFFERYLLTRSLKGLPDGHLMQFSTLSDTKESMPVFRPSKIVIYSGDNPNIIYDVMIGVSFSDFKHDNVDAILHPSLINI